MAHRFAIAAGCTRTDLHGVSIRLDEGVLGLNLAEETKSMIDANIEYGRK
jgi:hypothetical protein